jgi:hypothetical protein
VVPFARLPRAERNERLTKWQFLLRCLQFLKARDIGLEFGEPAKEYRQPTVEAVDVEGRDLHWFPICLALIYRTLTHFRAAYRGAGQSACILDGGKRHYRSGAARQTAASAI